MAFDWDCNPAAADFGFLKTSEKYSGSMKG